jgi:hypothetical protein
MKWHYCAISLRMALMFVFYHVFAVDDLIKERNAYD